MFTIAAPSKKKFQRRSTLYYLNGPGGKDDCIGQKSATRETYTLSFLKAINLPHGLFSAKECGALPAIPGSNPPDSPNKTYTASVTIKCKAGYSQSGSGLTTCTENATWTAINITCKGKCTNILFFHFDKTVQLNALH